MKFIDLYKKESPLLLANVWDVQSSKIAEKLNFQAIGTSSSAISAILGYDDGEKMKFSELEFFVKRIVQHTNLPLSVDMESGYSRNPNEIAENIRRLIDLGVQGINLEDSIVDKERRLLNAEEFAKTLSNVTRLLQKENLDIFINIRTDAFLLGHPDPVKETTRRIQLYELAGANGIFTPCIESLSDIEAVVACTNLPINIMCMPNLPEFDQLAKAGVKRISMGNFLFDHMYRQFEDTLEKVILDNSFKSIFQC